MDIEFLFFFEFRLNYFSRLVYYFANFICFNTFLKGVAFRLVRPWPDQFSFAELYYIRQSSFVQVTLNCFVGDFPEPCYAPISVFYNIPSHNTNNIRPRTIRTNIPYPRGYVPNYINKIRL